MPNIHNEMELLVAKCGLTPLEAIKAATYDGARAVGVEARIRHTPAWQNRGLGYSARRSIRRYPPHSELLIAVYESGTLYISVLRRRALRTMRS